MYRIFVVIFFIYAASVAVLAHSWVDCVKYSPLSQTCLGYPRGYPGRRNISINEIYTYKIEGTPQSQPMCHPGNQASANNYNSPFSMATAEPGETIYMTWQSNGHLNDAMPTKAKILYYPDPSKEVNDFNQRDKAMVAGVMEFGTKSNCYEPSNPNSVCIGRWTVPADLKPGNTYHFVWLWDFGQNPAGEMYSTCFDLAIKDNDHAVDYTGPISELLKYGNPDISYIYGIGDTELNEINNVSNKDTPPLAHNAGAFPSSSIGEFPDAMPTVPASLDDSGDNPDPFAGTTPSLEVTELASSPPPAPPVPTPTEQVEVPLQPVEPQLKPGVNIKCIPRSR